MPRADRGFDRRSVIARKLGLEENAAEPGQFEGKCPECGRGGFSIKHPDRADYLHIWTGGKGHRCSPEVIRAAMLRKGIPSTWLGSYATRISTSIDTTTATRLEHAARDILSAPGIKPSDMRIMLAEALGQKVPADYSSFTKWAISIGIGRRQAYEAAARWVSSSGQERPSPGG